MRRLNPVSEAWRNYLYANGNSYQNDAENFLVRVQLITDSQEQILEAILENEPDMDLIRECKEEIAFQRDNLKEIIDDFCDYYKDIMANIEYEVDAEGLLDNLCKSGVISWLFEVAKEWEELGNKAYLIWNKLHNGYGDGLGHIRYDLCKAIFEILDKEMEI